MTEEPLYIDTDAVRAGGNEMLTAIEGLQPAPPATALTGSDPLSMAIISQVPSIQAPIVFGLPVLKEDATKTATGVKDAADRYEEADQMLGERIEKQAQMPGGPGAPGAGGVGAGGAGAAQNAAASQGGAMGQMGQLMGMPMQMAQQAAQLPMQAMGMAAALPQAVMQGVQSAMQQVGQLGGENSGDDASGPATDEVLRAEPADEKPGREDEPGAEAGQPRERAPETGGTGESPSQTAPPAPPRTPAPTRPADEGINL